VPPAFVGGLFPAAIGAVVTETFRTGAAAGMVKDFVHISKLCVP